MADPHATALYIDTLVASGDDCLQQAFEWKAWRRAGEPVCWELRRPLMQVVPRKELLIGKMLATSWDLQPYDTLGRQLCGDGHIKTSVKAAAARASKGLEATEDDAVKQEWSCTTASLVLLLAWLALFKKKVSQKAAARALWEALFSRLVPASTLSSWQELRVPAEQLASCGEEPRADGLCPCVQVALETWRSVAAASPAEEYLRRF